MNLLVIVVYDRLDNINRWLYVWKQCNQSAQMVIIHTGTNQLDIPQGIIYIRRPNIGFDIGSLQDVCLERLAGFPNDWEKMLWCTDDTFPMYPNFLDIFFNKLIHGVGCVAMEISPYVRKHIRTTGFAITKEVSKKLTFPVDPIITKEQCFFFEHRSSNIMYNQILAMKLNVLMVAPQATSPMFDFGYHRRLKHREAEHYATFPEEKKALPKVAIICPTYNNYPQIVSALLCQTYQNWELHIVHDGPGAVELPKDKRIKFKHTQKRSANWGHSIRRDMLQSVTGDYVVITNPDNYLIPTFIEKMLAGFQQGIIATYCSQMVHNYIGHNVINCSLKRGYLDCSGVMLKLAEAKAVGWNDVTSHSADWFFFNDIIKKYGQQSFARVEGCLLIHN
jgi:hypothetical protein